MKSPCKDCRYRTVGCHTVCKNYADYRAEADKAKKARERQYPIRDMQIEKSIQTAKREKRLKK